ncbi:MAG: hypothetical protein ACOYVF_03385 [Candidatus Zixiibacteriota bacterium]
MGRSKKARRCPRCGSKDVLLQDSFSDGVDLYVCADCDHDFEVGGSHGKQRDDDFDVDEASDQEISEDKWE